MMEIKPRTSMSEIDSLVQQIQEIIYHETMRTLSYLGEECVIRIRDRSGEESWFDQTGNLRSSIGYAVYDKGKQRITSAFESILQGQEGSRKGKQYVDSLAQQYANVYALVVVAGMEYAERVESLETKDVLASTELWAKSVIDERMSRAKERIEKKINQLLK